MKKLLLALILGTTLLSTGCQSPQVEQQASAKENRPQIQYAFTQEKQHPEKLLIGAIDNSKATLDIAIYSLTHPDIVKAILNAKQRGVTVRIITDKQQASGKTQKQALKMLKDKGIPIKENTHSGLMHMKVTIADKSVVTTGSFNYTAAAVTKNCENLMVLPIQKIAEDYDADFESMWNDTKRFQDWK